MLRELNDYLLLDLSPNSVYSVEKSNYVHLILFIFVTNVCMGQNAYAPVTLKNHA